MKNILLAACTLFIFSQCTEEDIAPNQAHPASVTEAAVLPADASGSMTISGVHTMYAPIDDCTSCTFVVPADMTVVDGSELNLTAGSVICMDKAVQYGDIDFVNLEGTEDNPIRIGACDIKAAPVKSAQAAK